MKKLKNLEIIFTVLAIIFAAFGLGFLIDSLVLGETNSYAFAYSIVSVVAFILCIVMITGLLVVYVLDKREEKISNKSLIILPSKFDKNFDVKDTVLLLSKNEPKTNDDEFPCLIERDLHSCYTCKCRALRQEQIILDRTLNSKKKIQEEKLQTLGHIISGITKETGLIVLRHKPEGKTFVPHDFINWPEPEQPITVVELVEDEIPEITFVPVEQVMEVAEVEPVVEAQVAYIDQEQPIELESVVEEPVVMPVAAEPVYIDEENEIILEPVVEEEVVLPTIEEPKLGVNPLAPVVDLTEATSQPKELIFLMAKQDGGVFVPHPFVEWPVEQEPEEPVEVKDISALDEIEHEKELVVEAEDLFEEEEMVGDDLHIFKENEKVRSVAMTLKRTVTTSLWTGKKNIVFVKRPPIRLFNKIYIIDRATSSIIGEAIVRMYERGLKKQIWNKYQRNSTITKDDYDKYYTSSLLACALVIKTISKYTNPISIASYGIKKVPSTFLYVSVEEE